MSNKTPSGVKKHHKTIKAENCQTAKLVIFFLQTKYFKVVQLSHDSSCTNSSISHRAVHSPIAFSQLQSYKVSETAHSRTITTPFSSIVVPMCTHSRAMFDCGIRNYGQCHSIYLQTAGQKNNINKSKNVKGETRYR